MITSISRLKSPILFLIVLSGVYLTSLHNYLLFHALAEILSVVVAYIIFIIAWNSRRFLKSDFFLFLGIGYLFVGSVDIVHTLAYKGMGVFPDSDANLPTQLWIAARYLQSVSLLIAVLFLRRKARIDLVIAGYAVAVSLLFLSIFYWKVFPDCFVTDVGLTPFKKVSEYIIGSIMLASMALLVKNQDEFNPGVLRLLLASLGVGILAELAFTEYVSVYGVMNLLGHLLKIVSFYLIYKAIIETGFNHPFALLFRDLKQGEEALRLANDELEMRVQERTYELQGVNEDLRDVLEDLRIAQEELGVKNEELSDAHQRVEAEKKRYQDLFEFAPDSYLVTDEDGIIREANSRASEFLNITPSLLVGKHLIGYVPALNRNSFRKKLKELSRSLSMQDKRMSFEWEMQLKPRKQVLLDAAITVTLSHHEGEEPLILWLIRDITERKRTEKQVRKSAALNEVLAEASRAMAASGPDAQAVLESLAKTVAFWIGDTCIIRLKSEDGGYLTPIAYHHPVPEALAILEEMLSVSPQRVHESVSGEVFRTGEPIRIASVSREEFHSAMPTDPRYLPFIERFGASSVVAVPIILQGTVVGTIVLGRHDAKFPYTLDDQVLLQNLAERASLALVNARLYKDLQKALQEEKRIRQQLVMAEKHSAMGRLLASVAHELNNPIQTIQNCLYLAHQDSDSDSSIAEYLEMAFQESQRAGKLVAQVRNLYRPNKTSDMEPVDLLLLLDEVHALLFPHMQDQKIAWEQSPSVWPDGMKVAGIADQLKQVFLNLSLNAIEAMQPAGGTLYLEICPQPEAGQVWISFRDTGPGVSPDSLPNLFEPFFTTKGSGLGLGLSICYDIIQQHKGQIIVESQPGLGANFKVWLPLLQDD